MYMHVHTHSLADPTGAHLPPGSHTYKQACTHTHRHRHTQRSHTLNTAERKGESPSWLCMVRGMEHRQDGHSPDTVLEVRGREGAAGAEDQGLLFSSMK